jgi:hypothetical protein
VGPSANASEEVAGRVALQVFRSNVADVSLIDFPVRDQPGLHQLPEPRGGLRVELGVVGHRSNPVPLSHASTVQYPSHVDFPQHGHAHGFAGG